MFWKPTLPVNADVASFVVSVTEKLQARKYAGAPAAWIKELRERDTAVEEKNLYVFCFIFPWVSYC